jgi:hypothetical protein
MHFSFTSIRVQAATFMRSTYSASSELCSTSFKGDLPDLLARRTRLMGRDNRLTDQLCP